MRRKLSASIARADVYCGRAEVMEPNGQPMTLLSQPRLCHNAFGIYRYIPLCAALTEKGMRMKTKFTDLFTVAIAVALLSACGGGGGGGGTTPGSGGTTPSAPAPTPLPTATLSLIVPATGEAGVARGVKPVITLAVSNATSSDASKLSFLCANRTITFTSTSAFSADAKSVAVTLTPQTDAILAGDTCTLSGDVSTTGPGGTVKTTISTSFSIYAVKSASALTLIAGTADSPGSKSGTLLEASFHTPYAMTKDTQGAIYVADGCTGLYDSHSLIRKIAPDGTVTTIAGSRLYGGGMGTPPPNYRCISGITAQPDGNLYASDTSTILRITPQGQITTIAGAFNQTGSADGVGTAARFSGVGGIAADTQGNLFIADIGNHTIRRIDPSGNVTTYAGQAGVSGNADGSLQNARFRLPSALKFDDSSGKLYVTDRAGGIRVIYNGTVSTVIPVQQLYKDLCGSGGATGTDLSADGLDVSSDGRIAVAYADCGQVGIYQNNQLSVVLGSYRGSGGFGDADGLPSVSRFNWPSGVTFLSNGDLLISDIGNHNIKRYSASTNSVGLYVGQRNYLYPIDGIGSAAKLDNPYCLYHSTSGETWFSQDNHIVRKINAAGSVTTVLNGTYSTCVLKVNDDGSFITASEVSLNGGGLRGVIRLYSQIGALLQTLATLADDFPFPLYSAVAANGDIFFTNKVGGIRKYSGGVVSEFTQPIDPYPLQGLAVTKTGDLIASTLNGSIVTVSSSGTVATLASWGIEDGAGVAYIGSVALAVDSNGAIYVAHQYGSVIRKFYNGRWDTVAGTLWIDETELGPGPGKIFYPREIAYDAASNSLIVMTYNAILRAQLPQ